MIEQQPMGSLGMQGLLETAITKVVKKTIDARKNKMPVEWGQRIFDILATTASDNFLSKADYSPKNYIKFTGMHDVSAAIRMKEQRYYIDELDPENYPYLWFKNRTFHLHYMQISDGVVYTKGDRLMLIKGDNRWSWLEHQILDYKKGVKATEDIMLPMQEGIMKISKTLYCGATTLLLCPALTHLIEDKYRGAFEKPVEGDILDSAKLRYMLEVKDINRAVAFARLEGKL